jgi:hypothetical protein
MDRHKNKKERIQLRVVPMHKSLLRAKSNMCNMSLSNYMIRCGLQQHISPPKSKVEQDFIRELSRIGNNLNQIAYGLNSAQEPSLVTDKLQNIAEELKLLRGLI